MPPYAKLIGVRAYFHEPYAYMLCLLSRLGCPTVVPSKTKNS